MEKIKQQVYDVIKYSQGIENPQVDELIEKWYKAKEKFISVFGGYVYNAGPVEFHLSETARTDKVQAFIDKIDRTYQNHSLVEFIKENYDGFFKNQVVEDYAKIPRGMKLVKAFKFFINDENVLKDLQNEASRIIQEDKVQGDLYFSVHPLDFLSSSENDYNWRSCHSLDGEFRSGNLSYMCDSSTFICYVRTQDNMLLPNFPSSVPWNSKKWRMLMFMSNKWDMAFAGRQYPFEAETALDVISKSLINIKEFNSITYHGKGRYPACWEHFIIDDHRLYDRYIAFHGRLHELKKIVKDNSPLHYNDLLYSTCYTPYYAFDRVNFEMDEDLPLVEVGYHVNCLDCGKEPIMNGETMRCLTCELDHGDTPDNDIFGTCDCCGRRMLWDDALRMKNDWYICPTCYREEVYECPCCTELIFNIDKIYDYNREEYYCSECIEDMKYE